MNLSKFSIVVFFILGIISLSLSYMLSSPHQYYASLFFGILGNVLEFMIVVEVLKYVNRKK